MCTEETPEHIERKWLLASQGVRPQENKIANTLILILILEPQNCEMLYLYCPSHQAHYILRQPYKLVHLSGSEIWEPRGQME